MHPLRKCYSYVAVKEIMKSYIFSVLMLVVVVRIQQLIDVSIIAFLVVEVHSCHIILSNLLLCKVNSY
jgi:hypothetical protein